MDEKAIKDVSIRVCRSINDAVHHWRYFYALLDFSPVFTDGSLVTFKRLLTSTKSAHMGSAVAGLYTLLDTSGKKYVTLKTYAEALRAHGHEDLAKKVEDFFASHQDAIKSVSLLRHQYVAHRPIKNDEAGAFKLAQFKLGYVDAMVDDLVELYTQVGKVGDRKYISPPSTEELRNEVAQLFELAVDAYLPIRSAELDKLHSQMP